MLSVISKQPGAFKIPEHLTSVGEITASIAVVESVSVNQTVVFCNLTKNLSTKSTFLSFPKLRLPIEFLNFYPPIYKAYIMGSNLPNSPLEIIGTCGNLDLSSKQSEATLNHPDLSIVSNSMGTFFLPAKAASGPTPPPPSFFSPSFPSPSFFSPSASPPSAAFSSPSPSAAPSSCLFLNLNLLFLLFLFLC